jgi:hypothetical protein
MVESFACIGQWFGINLKFSFLTRKWVFLLIGLYENIFFQLFYFVVIFSHASHRLSNVDKCIVHVIKDVCIL